MNVSPIAVSAAWISCLLALVGAIGPWAKAIGVTASGLDGSNDGWLVLILALVAAALILGAAFARRRWSVALICLAAFAAGVGVIAIGFYDRHNISTKISQLPTDFQGAVSVGWGLNLTIVAGFLMMISCGAVWAAWSSPSRALGVEAVQPDVAPPGWYPDPLDETRSRYWDGNAWSQTLSREDDA